MESEGDRSVISTVVLDASLTAPEFESLSACLGALLGAFRDHEMLTSVLTASGVAFFRHVLIRDEETVETMANSILENFFHLTQLRPAQQTPSFEDLLDIALRNCLAYNERYFCPVAVIVTTGRRWVNYPEARKRLVRFSQRNIPLVVVRVSGDTLDLASDDDGFRWACAQTPFGHYCTLNSEEQAIDLSSALFHNRLGLSLQPLNVEQDNWAALKLIEYDIPRVSVHQVEEIFEARKREGFRSARRDHSPKRYPDANEASFDMLWSPSLILEFLATMDPLSRRIKCQFRLRGPHAVCKAHEADFELVEKVEKSMETDIVITHICGPNGEQANQLVLTTQPISSWGRFMRTTSVEAVCAPGATPEIISTFGNQFEWLIPEKLIRIFCPAHELDRTCTTVREAKKVMLVAVNRISIIGLFDPFLENVTSITRVIHVLRKPETLASDDAAQEVLLTLGLLWRRRGFFQLGDLDRTMLDFAALPSGFPPMRLTAVASKKDGVVATITLEVKDLDTDEYTRLLQDDEQVLGRLQLFVELTSVKELLPYARRTLSLDLPHFASLSQSESSEAFASAVTDVFTTRIDKDGAYARYVSRDMLVVLSSNDSKWLLHDIRRSDLLPSAAHQQGHILVATHSSMIEAAGDDAGSTLIQFQTLLRSSYTRNLAWTVQQRSISLVAPGDAILVEEGCERTTVDVDLTRLSTVESLHEDFVGRLKGLFIDSCHLDALDEQQSIFLSAEGFVRFGVCSVSSKDEKEVSLTLENCQEVLQSAISESGTLRVLMRIHFLRPIASIQLASGRRGSSLAGSYIPTILFLEKELNTLVSTALLLHARRLYASKPESAVLLVRDTLNGAPECIRFDVPLSPFVASTVFEEDDDKLGLFCKELLSQNEYSLRAVAQTSQSNNASNNGSNVSSQRTLLCHCDEDGWSLLEIKYGVVHANVWSFTDPTAKVGSSKVSAIVSKFQRRTNQLLLLGDLHDSRMASSQLIPVSTHDYPFYACPLQKQVEIPLGRHVSTKRVLKELSISPSFFIRNRERWFVYRLLSNRISYFTCAGSHAIRDEDDNDDFDDNAKYSVLSIDIYAIDQLAQNSVDHLVKVLRDIVIELAVEGLSNHIQKLPHAKRSIAMLPESQWDLELLLSNDGNGSRLSQDLHTKSPHILRHLIAALSKRLLIVVGDGSEIQLQTKLIKLLSIVEDCLLVVQLERHSESLNVQLSVPSRRGNAVKGLRSFLATLQHSLEAAEKSALFEQRLLEEEGSISNFEALLNAARDACGSVRLEFADIVQASSQDLGRGDEFGHGAGESVYHSLLPRWSLLYLLRDIERRVKQEVGRTFHSNHAFRAWLRRVPQSSPGVWGLLDPVDEDRALSVNDDGLLPTDDSSDKRGKGPFIVESLALLLANHLFWVKPRSASVSSLTSPQRISNSSTNETHVTAPSDDPLRILIVLASAERIELVGFVLDETEMECVIRQATDSARWLIGRIAALSNTVVQELAMFGKRHLVAPLLPARRASSLNAMSLGSPRITRPDSSSPTRDQVIDPAQDVARWTQDRRGQFQALRSMDEVLRVLRCCRPVLSFRAAKLCNLPEPIPSSDICARCGIVLEGDLKMTLIAQDAHRHVYFAIVNGTHLIMANLIAADGGYCVDVVVRELGKHFGGQSLSLALAAVHEAVPRTRAHLYDLYAERVETLLLECVPAGVSIALEFGRLTQSENWSTQHAVATVQIACEVRQVNENDLDDWTSSLLERAEGESIFRLANALILLEDSCTCVLVITKVTPQPSSKGAVVLADSCVLLKDRTDLSRYIFVTTQWAKNRVEVCSADVRWKAFWRAVKRGTYGNDLPASGVMTEDIIGEEERVSLTMIDTRFDDILNCIEQGIKWEAPLQRLLSHSGWLVAPLQPDNVRMASGFLLTREECADRFAVFAVAEEGSSTVFDLLFRFETDVRRRPPELQNMLSLLLRSLGAVFLDACVARVGHGAFSLAGRESAVMQDPNDFGPED